MLEIHSLSDRLEKGQGGIYFSSQTQQISYPEAGNAHYALVEENSFWFRHRNNIILAAIQKYSPQHPFFDIGGGNGFVASAIQANQIPVVLVEPGIAGCQKARERGLHHIICSSFQDAGFAAGSLGSVGLFDVVEHIEDDHGFLTDIYEKMQVGMYAFINVPAYQFLWSGEDIDAGHFRRYTLSRITNLMKSCGFTMIYASYLFSPLPFPIFMMRSIPYRLRLHRGPSTVSTHQHTHRERKGFLQSSIQACWRWEVSQVRAGKSIPFGSSCFVVGKK